MSHALQRIRKELGKKQSDEELWLSRADAIIAGCNAKQKGLVIDTSKVKSLRCPRRSGKTFGMTSAALELGERVPGARILVISLSIKHCKENYWSAAPGGIFAQNKKYDLKLTFNHTELTWTHENGSRGRLAGAETRADIEYFRGAAAEADLIIIDECKSFAPDLLRELITDVILPGLATRDGTLIMGGTPGSIPTGPFYEATCLEARVPDPDEQIDEDGKPLFPDGVPSCVLWSDNNDLPNEDHRYSLHTWTVQDNNATEMLKGQWQRFLNIKKSRGWKDDSAVWRREFLGEWVTDITEVVYSFSRYKYEPNSRVLWEPDPDCGITGLNPEEGPWHIVMGLDFGYEDSDAIVLAGYSETKQELRHIFDWKKNHLDIDAFCEQILSVIDLYGTPEVIVGDAGALGKKITATLNSRHGLSILPADKNRKLEYIELLNSDFSSGRVRIIRDSALDNELCALQWDLSKDKTLMIRTGKLKEDPKCPNHLCDALLYLWRYAYHYWATPLQKEIDKGTEQWYKEAQKKSIESYKKKLRSDITTDPISRAFKEMKRNDYRRI